MAKTTKKAAAKTTTKKATTAKKTAAKKPATKKSTTAKKADSKKTTKAKVIDMKTKQEVGMKVEAITALENAGFKRWKKGKHDRLYISPSKLGLKIEDEGSTFMGEPIDAKECERMRASKTYIDVNTGDVCSGNDRLESAASALYSKVLALKEIGGAEALV